MDGLSASTVSSSRFIPWYRARGWEVILRGKRMSQFLRYEKGLPIHYLRSLLFHTPTEERGSQGGHSSKASERMLLKVRVSLRTGMATITNLNSTITAILVSFINIRGNQLVLQEYRQFCITSHTLPHWALGDGVSSSKVIGHMNHENFFVRSMIDRYSRLDTTVSMVSFTES